MWRTQIFIPLELCKAQISVASLPFTSFPKATYIVSSLWAGDGAVLGSNSSTISRSRLIFPLLLELKRAKLMSGKRILLTAPGISTRAITKAQVNPSKKCAFYIDDEMTEQKWTLDFSLQKWRLHKGVTCLESFDICEKIMEKKLKM